MTLPLTVAPGRAPAAADPAEAAIQRHLLSADADIPDLANRLRDSLRAGGLALGHAESVLGLATGEWSLEPVPLVLPAAEWRIIEAAVCQRARLLEALHKDIYGEQTCLRQKILPPELVLADPFYRRPCKGLGSDAHPRINLIRFDLVRLDGTWRFVQTHTNTPLGLFLALQNRRILAQEADAFYADLPPYHGISDFPIELVSALRALAPNTEGPPNIVVLSSGPGDPYFAEHSFLARKMGVPLAQGDDLIVLDNRVHFKSIEGLDPVDVIYRRLHDGHIDPVVFPTDRNLAGVAGLLGCIRSGTVRVANAIGAGTAENRALHAYLPGLCRHFLGERPHLPSLRTYYCGDQDQLAQVLESGGRLEIHPIHDTLPSHPVIGSVLRGLDREALVRNVRQHPHFFTGQEPVRADTHLCLAGGTPVRRPVRLSVFVLHSARGLSVMPGGLGVLAPLPGERGVSLQHLDPSLEPATDARGGHISHLALAETPAATGAFPLAIGLCCDVVVLRDERAAAPSREPPSVRLRNPVLGSRAAENLFWLGRYAERAENTARMVALMAQVGLEDLAAADRERWFPRWLGFLKATGHSLSERRRDGGIDDAAWQLMLDPQNPSSARASCELVHENAARARDFLSPECFGMLNRLRILLSNARREPQRTGKARRAATDEAIEAVLTFLPGFQGTLRRTMPSDPGVRFLDAGARLERCVTTAAALRHALREAEELGVRPHTPHPLHGALVRLLVSHDAFHRAYQAPANAALVSSFFLHNRESPQSIENGLAHVIEQLELLGGDQAFPESPPRLAAAHLRFVREIPLERALSGESAGPLSEHIEELLTRLFSLSDAIGDFYMNHQARFCA